MRNGVCRGEGALTLSLLVALLQDDSLTLPLSLSFSHSPTLIYSLADTARTPSQTLSQTHSLHVSHTACVEEGSLSLCDDRRRQESRITRGAARSATPGASVGTVNSLFLINLLVRYSTRDLRKPHCSTQNRDPATSMPKRKRVSPSEQDGRTQRQKTDVQREFPAVRQMDTS